MDNSGAGGFGDYSNFGFTRMGRCKSRHATSGSGSKQWRLWHDLKPQSALKSGINLIKISFLSSLLRRFSWASSTALHHWHGTDKFGVRSAEEEAFDDRLGRNAGRSLMRPVVTNSGSAARWRQAFISCAYVEIPLWITPLTVTVSVKSDHYDKTVKIMRYAEPPLLKMIDT
jgi:hypothetical protein